MFTRFLVAVPLAAAATGGLFLLMRVLTDPSPAPLPPKADAGNASGPVISVDVQETGSAPHPREVGSPSADRDAIAIIQYSPYPQCGPGRSGKVVLDFAVETNGAVSDVKVISATSRCFAMAAKLSVLTWRYRPKIDGGRPVRSRVRETLNLYSPPDLPLRDIPDISEPPFGPATPLVRVPPAYPPCGEGHGEVTIEFFVEADGHIRDVTVVNATSNCFAHAAISAAKGWRYRPRYENGETVRSKRQRVKLAFHPD